MFRVCQRRCFLPTYEVGFKSDLFDRQLRFNASAFHYDYEDIQLFAITGSTAFLVNAAKGRIRGVDLETVFQPNVSVGEFSITANASFLDAKYTSFPNAQFFYPNPSAPCGPTTSPNPSQSLGGTPTGGNRQCVGDASGHRMIKAPKFTLSTAVNYIIPVGDNKIGFNATWSHNSGYFFDPDSRLKQDDFDLVNMQLSYIFGDGDFAVRGFVRNAFNTKWIPANQTSTLTDSYIPGDPRTYGVAVDFKF